MKSPIKSSKPQDSWRKIKNNPIVEEAYQDERPSDSRDYQEAPIKTCREPEIHVAVDRLRNTVEENAKLTSHLVDRLTAVLGQDHPKQDSKETAEKASTTPLGKSITDARYVVERTNTLIQVVTSLLEI